MSKFLDFNVQTIKKGTDYYKNGLVQLVFQSNKTFKTIVTGTKKYICELTLNNKTIIDARCTCPVTKDACKHVYASILLYKGTLEQNKITSYQDLINLLQSRFQSQAFSNIDNNVALNNLNYCFSNIDSLSEAEIIKVLHYCVQNQIRYLNKQVISNYLKSFLSLYNQHINDKKINDGFCKYLLDNKTLFISNINDFIDVLLLDETMSKSMNLGIKQYLTINGLDMFMYRLLSSAIINDYKLEEDIYISLLSFTDIINNNIKPFIRNCINNKFINPLKQISITYRDILDEKECLELYNLFKNKNEITSAITLSEYLLKKYNKLDYYILLKNCLTDSELKEKLPIILNQMKKNNLDVAIKVYEQIEIKPVELKKISVKDLLYLKSKIPSYLVEAYVERIFEITKGLADKKIIDPIIYKLLLELYNLNPISYSLLLFNQDFISKINTPLLRKEFLYLLDKTNKLKDFKIFKYGD